MKRKRYGLRGALFDRNTRPIQRFKLTRVWDKDNDRRVCFRLLNPSNADSVRSGSTLCKYMDYALSWDEKNSKNREASKGLSQDVNRVAEHAKEQNKQLWCFGKNKSGSPMHPSLAYPMA